MLPTNQYEDEIEEEELQEQEMPSKTYYMDQQNKVIVGTCDDDTALRQALYKILNTEFAEYVIYDNYGFEKKDLHGKDMIYVQSELKERIREAVLSDDRFESVDDFSFERTKNKLHVRFTVTTAEMNEQIEKEVDVIV